jgi:lambda family phage minor tail protein L
MSQQKVNLEATKFNPSSLLSLYELDASAVGGPHLYFHDGSSNNYQNITLDGQEYTAFPIFMEGFEYDGKGSLPRPRLRAANVNGFVSAYILGGSSLINARFMRRRIFARYIDAVNFTNGVNPFGTPDPTAVYPDDVFVVNRKVTENRQYVEFELSTPLEIDNVMLPNRQIFAHICGFKYRDSSCGYSGVPVGDKNNRSFGPTGYNFTLVDQGEYDEATTYNIGDYVFITSTLPQTSGELNYFVCNANGTVGLANGPLKKPANWVQDYCSKSIPGCRLRYISPTTLRFGGFPGASRGGYSI